MRNPFQSKFRTGIALAAVLVLFSWMYFSKKLEGFAALGVMLKHQNAEIVKLQTAIERMQTLNSLGVDLSLKLFSDDAQPLRAAATSSSASGALSSSVLTATRRFNVDFVSMDRAPDGNILRFGGRYPDIARFLSAVETEFQHIEGFTIEKSKNGGVLLSMTVANRQP